MTRCLLTFGSRIGWCIVSPVGKGESALAYLASYIFHVAISDWCILKLEEGRVTFRYKPSNANHWKLCMVTTEEFLRRFLQHVLPKGFVRVRYHGLSSPMHRHLLAVIRLWLDVPASDNSSAPAWTRPAALSNERSAPRSPTCGYLLRAVQELRPRSRCPPSLAELGPSMNCASLGPDFAGSRPYRCLLVLSSAFSNSAVRWAGL